MAESSLVYISEFVSPESPSVAFSRRSTSLAAHLSNSGYRVTVLSPEADSGRRLEGDLDSRVLVSHRIRKKLNSDPISRLAFSLFFAARLVSFLHTTRPHHVIVSFHSPVLVFAVIAATRLASRTALLDVQDSWLYSARVHRGALRNIVRIALERLALRLSMVTTTVTPTLKLMLSSGYRIPEEKIHVVYNGCNPMHVTARESRDVDILHLGSPRVQYDTVSLIDALDILADAGHWPSLVFLGCTDEPYVGDVRKRAARSKVASRVRFLPPVPPSEVPDWIARSRIGVFTLPRNPIYGCAIGAKVFEYLAGGLPVAHLGPSDGETARLIQRENCGVVATAAEEFADALSRLLSDDGYRGHLALSARKAAERYTWNTSAQDMAAALEAHRGNRPESVR